MLAVRGGVGGADCLAGEGGLGRLEGRGGGGRAAPALTPYGWHSAGVPAF